jgi:hypothetical protein
MSLPEALNGFNGDLTFVIGEVLELIKLRGMDLLQSSLAYEFNKLKRVLSSSDIGLLHRCLVLEDP